MPAYTWAALAVFLVLTGAGLAAVVAAFVRLLRAAGNAGGTVEQAALHLALATEGLAERGERLAARQEQLQRSLQSLRDAFGQIDTLRWALRDPLRALRLLRMLRPRR